MLTIDRLEIVFLRYEEDEKDLQALSECNPTLFTYHTVHPGLITIRLSVAGLHRLPDGSVITAHEHHAELLRPLTYPLETGPLVRFVTPGVQHIHPNICPLTGGVCYGALEPDRWAPSLGLNDIVLILARMLRLEIFNLGDVINTSVESAQYVRRLAQEGGAPLDGPVLLHTDATEPAAMREEADPIDTELDSIDIDDWDEVLEDEVLEDEEIEDKD